MSTIKLFVCACLLLLAGCTEMPQVPMTATQTDDYNQCMSHHWSSFADSALFGVAGYEYHQNMVLGCRQAALAQPEGQTTSIGAARVVARPAE
ncbi:MAG: hypothetical protein JO166_09565 [Deltaproteobacteria bacterium]|nr:hypothetical protein [Deltaproteobacteria bacterium]